MNAAAGGGSMLLVGSDGDGELPVSCCKNRESNSRRRKSGSFINKINRINKIKVKRKESSSCKYLLKRSRFNFCIGSFDYFSI